MRVPLVGLLGLVTGGGGSAYYFYRTQGGWDPNWDGRAAQPKARATRHLFLIRHGQYVLDASEPDLKRLTALGQTQLNHTGRQLLDLHPAYDRIVHSTLIRAVQSSEIIQSYLKHVPVEVDPDLCEGFPWVPIPYHRDCGSPSDHDRIERAFKRYFHRAPPDQEKDSFEVIVCHANVIRYFVCRALQLPPAAWLRMSLYHGSITAVDIRPSGNVSVRVLGDIGFMPPDLHTTS